MTLLKDNKNVLFFQTPLQVNITFGYNSEYKDSTTFFMYVHIKEPFRKFKLNKSVLFLTIARLKL